jgi:PAS domain S-box-containing protein
MINLVKVRMKAFSIKTKFTMIAMMICVVSFGVAAFFSTRWLREEIQGDYKEKAMLISLHIIDDLESVMLQNAHEEILKTLAIYKGYKKEVEEVRIFNIQGKEVFSQEQGLPEAKVEEVLRSGEPIHYHKEMNKRDVATFIIPIKNRPECYACHGKGERLRGALLLSLNQKEMKQYIGQEEQRFLVLFGLIAIGTILATLIAVNRLFLNPLNTIQKGAEAIGRGDFAYQFPVRRMDEIGNLTENFNRMAQTLRNSFKEISRSKKEWEETFDRINDPIVVIDSNCNILKANVAFRETFFRLPKWEEIGRKCSELFGTCLLSDCPHKISIQDKEPVTREIHNQKMGKIFEISVFPYYSPEEVFSGSVAIIKDVTEKKENEMRLVMSERLAALGEMASGIAHEINNPLGTIAACTEALLGRMEKEKIGSILFENYLRIIQDEINRCKNITNSMLSFVKKREDGKLHVEVNEVVEKTLEMVNFEGRLKDVVVLRNYQEEIPVIHYDEGNLRQAFLSIIANAVDAMEGKGTLTIETGIIPPILTLEKSVQLETEGGSPDGVGNPAPQGKGGFVFVKISDTGPGIPPHLINRIFDPFFTTKSKKGGTGLGLSIADKIIKENNGKIDAISEEGKGTTFTITLPI